jgi:hypothetical protein
MSDRRRLTEYQVGIVRGWAKDYKRAGLPDLEAFERCSLQVDNAGHVLEIVTAVYASKGRRS